MANKNIVYRKNAQTGEIEYPVTSSAAVGMSDGSGSLDNKLTELESNIGYYQQSGTISSPKNDLMPVFIKAGERALIKIHSSVVPYHLTGLRKGLHAVLIPNITEADYEVETSFSGDITYLGLAAGDSETYPIDYSIEVLENISKNINNNYEVYQSVNCKYNVGYINNTGEAHLRDTNWVHTDFLDAANDYVIYLTGNKGINFISYYDDKGNYLSDISIQCSLNNEVNNGVIEGRDDATFVRFCGKSSILGKYKPIISQVSIDSSLEKLKTNNIMPYATIEGYIDNDGNYNSKDTHWFASDYIHVNTGDIVLLNILSGNELVNSISYYNINKEYQWGYVKAQRAIKIDDEGFIKISYFKGERGSINLLSEKNIPYICEKVYNLEKHINEKIKSKVDLTKNGWIDLDGNIKGNRDTNWVHSDFIKIDDKSEFTVTLKGVVDMYIIAYYDENYSFISGIGNEEVYYYNNQLIMSDVPSDATFVRFCGKSDDFGAYNSKVEEVITSFNIQKEFINENTLPSVIYLVCNDIIGDSVKIDELKNSCYPNDGNLTREMVNKTKYGDNRAAIIHLDHLFSNVKEEPSYREKQSGTTRMIFYSPIVQTDISTMTLNKGLQKYEYEDNRGIVSAKNKNDVLINIPIKVRSTLASSVKNVTPKILVIGASVSWGEGSMLNTDGYSQHHNFASYAKEFFMMDNINNNGENEAIFIGTCLKKGTFNYNNEIYNTRICTESIPGASIDTFLTGSTKFFDDTLSHFSISTYIENYRTLDDLGVRLSSESENPAGEEVQGSDGKQYTIGKKITSKELLNNYDVCTPTHVFIKLGANGSIPTDASKYNQLITYIKADLPNVIIGVGEQDDATTIFPSLYPYCTNKIIEWESKVEKQGSRHELLYAINKVLQQEYSNTESESNNVYYVPIYYVVPPVKSAYMRLIKSPECDIDFSTDANIIIDACGWHPVTHLNGIGQISMGYQLYSWLKWTM